MNLILLLLVFFLSPEICPQGLVKNNCRLQNSRGRNKAALRVGILAKTRHVCGLRKRLKVFPHVFFTFKQTTLFCDNEGLFALPEFRFLFLCVSVNNERLKTSSHGCVSKGYIHEWQRRNFNCRVLNPPSS